MSKIKQIKCVEYITVSSFNPVPPHRKIKGDLLYLTVRMLDNSEHGITCTASGFFRNDSSERGQF
jgi:protein TIF31